MLQEDSVLDLNVLPVNLSIRANTTPSTIVNGGVDFLFQGSLCRRETGAPHMMGGNTGSDNYPAEQLRTVGRVSVMARPWRDANPDIDDGTSLECGEAHSIEIEILARTSEPSKAPTQAPTHVSRGAETVPPATP